MAAVITRLAACPEVAGRAASSFSLEPFSSTVVEIAPPERAPAPPGSIARDQIGGFPFVIEPNIENRAPAIRRDEPALFAAAEPLLLDHASAAGRVSSKRAQANRPGRRRGP